MNDVTIIIIIGITLLIITLILFLLKRADKVQIDFLGVKTKVQRNIDRRTEGEQKKSKNFKERNSNISSVEVLNSDVEGDIAGRDIIKSSKKDS